MLCRSCQKDWLERENKKARPHLERFWWHLTTQNVHDSSVINAKSQGKLEMAYRSTRARTFNLSYDFEIMNAPERIEGTGFYAEVTGENPWLFSYSGSQTFEVSSYKTSLHVSSKFLSTMPELEQEQVFDAFWALAEPLGFEHVCIAYRLGDPYETYIVRP